MVVALLPLVVALLTGLLMVLLPQPLLVLELRPGLHHPPFSPPRRGKDKHGPTRSRPTWAWTPKKQQETLFPLDPPVECNRPGCKELLQRFVPPGTNSDKGITFEK